MELTDGSQKHRLVKLRNPWAKEKYTGPWSDGSSEWTDDLSKQAKHTMKDDGTFFVPFKIYVDYFRTTNLAIHEKFGYVHYWKFE